MEKDKSKIKFTILAIVLITVFCFAVTPITLQNDTYYTIKIGEHIVNNGIDMKDPFSWHKDLNYTYPHWLYDLVTYFIYSFSGFGGIYIATVILTIILGITIYLTNTKLTKNRLTSFIITIGIMYVIQKFIAARAQLVTFILFTLTVYFIEMFLETKKKRYAIGLIIIPAIIANVHSAVFPFYFVLYLPYIGEYIMCKISNCGTLINNSKIKKFQKEILKTNDKEKIEEIKNKISELEAKQIRIDAKQKNQEKKAYKIKMVKNDNIKYLVIIMIICIFTGLLTPLGFTPYTYLVKTMQGNTTHNISEHLPLVLADNLNMEISVVIFLAILTFTDTKIRLKDLFMLGGLMFLAFYSRRQESMFIIICGFILNRLLCQIFNKYDSSGCEKVENRMTKIVGMITTIATVLIIIMPIFKSKKDDKILDESTYPVQASEYILQNLDVNNIRLYNEYNYGSYLLFKGIPVFVDSRADLYSPEFNKNVNVFTDFLNLSGLGLTNIEAKLDEYGITHMIMYKNAKLKTFIDQTPEKYKKLYEDEHFCIYERKTLTLNVAD